MGSTPSQEEALLGNNVSFEELEEKLYHAAVRHHHEQDQKGWTCSWCAKPVWSKDQLSWHVAQTNEDIEYYYNKEYSLQRGLYESDVPKVEIEDTELIALQEPAWQRIQELWSPILPSGAILWSLVVGCGLMAGLFSDCRSGAPLYIYVVLALATGFQILTIEKLSILMSRTTFEGRPMVATMHKLSGLSGYHFLVGFAMLDLSGKFTRALFVGHALKCSDADRGLGLLSLNDKFKVAFDSSRFAFLSPVVDFMGIGGFSLSLFLFGTLLFQGFFMMRSLDSVLSQLKRSKDHLGKPHSMGLYLIMDDFAAVAGWSVLNPVRRVFDTCALPIAMEDWNDAHRIWDQMRTKAYGTLANVMPDAVFMMGLQARFLALGYSELQRGGVMKILFSVGCSLFTVLTTVRTMWNYNAVLPCIVACTLGGLSLEPILRIVFVFVCESHVVNLMSFSCVPEGALTVLNTTLQ